MDTITNKQNLNFSFTYNYPYNYPYISANDNVSYSNYSISYFEQYSNSDLNEKHANHKSDFRLYPVGKFQSENSIDYLNIFITDAFYAN
jgi:hypothetical protein